MRGGPAPLQCGMQADNPIGSRRSRPGYARRTSRRVPAQLLWPLPFAGRPILLKYRRCNAIFPVASISPSHKRRRKSSNAVCSAAAPASVLAGIVRAGCVCAEFLNRRRIAALAIGFGPASGINSQRGADEADYGGPLHLQRPLRIRGRSNPCGSRSSRPPCALQINPCPSWHSVSEVFHAANKPNARELCLPVFNEIRFNIGDNLVRCTGRYDRPYVHDPMPVEDQYAGAQIGCGTAQPRLFAKLSQHARIQIDSGAATSSGCSEPQGGNTAPG